MLILIFYMHFFSCSLDDPLRNNLTKEMIAFLLILITSVGLSWDSGKLKCLVTESLEDLNKDKMQERMTLDLLYAFIFSFLPILAIPFFMWKLG